MSAKLPELVLKGPRIRRRPIEQVVVLAAAGAVITAGLLLHYYSPAYLHLAGCPFYTLTGLYCPGCGSTRALHHLLNLDPATAFRCNALSVLALPFLVAHFGVDGLNRLKLWPRSWRVPRLDLSADALRALTVIVVLWTIVRNLPFAVFVIPPQ